MLRNPAEIERRWQLVQPLYFLGDVMLGYLLCPPFLDSSQFTIHSLSGWLYQFFLESLWLAFEIFAIACAIFVLCPEQYHSHVSHYLDRAFETRHDGIRPQHDPYSSRTLKALLNCAHNPSWISLGQAVGRIGFLGHLLSFHSWSMLIGIHHWALVLRNFINGFPHTARTLSIRSRYLAGIGMDRIFLQAPPPQNPVHLNPAAGAPVIILIFADQQPLHDLFIAPIGQPQRSHYCPHNHMRHRGS